MISRFSWGWLRFCCVRLAPFVFWLLTLVLPSTAWSQGNFLPGVNYPVTGQGKIAVGDVNGDNKLDVVVANQDNTVGILLGNGDGTLQAETMVTVLPSGSPMVTQAVAVGDFNGDGILDLAVLCNTSASTFVAPNNITGAIEILLGSGGGNFQTPVEYPIDGMDPTLIFTTDFRNNGKLDLAVLNQASNNITILLGNGDGTFGTAVDYAIPSGTTAKSMAIGDLNGDGHADVAVAGLTSVDGVISVLLANSDGSLGQGTNWITTTSAICARGCQAPTAVAIADLNNDGKPDLIADNGPGGGLVSFLGNGDGTFNAAIPSGPPPLLVNTGSSASFATGDFNTDGKQDVAEAEFSVPSYDGDLAIFLGNGDGTFQSPLYIEERLANLSSEALSVVSADMNGDGFTDLVLGTAQSGTSTGPFTVTVALNCGLRCTSTSLTSSGPTSSFNQSITFTATVTALSPKATSAPTGTVSFQDTFPVANLGTATLVSGSATFVYSGLSAGSHSIIAIYEGDQNFTASTSSTIQQNVYQASTTTAISSSPNPSNSGQSVTFAAVVSPSTSGVPTGSVAFSDNGNQSASVVLDATGSASFSTSSLTTGTHSITWSYSGDSNFMASTSPTLTQIVGTNAAPFVITPNSTSATVPAGQSASFGISLVSVPGFTTPVTFICSGLPVDSSCQFQPSSLTPNGKTLKTMVTIMTTARNSVLFPTPRWFPACGAYFRVVSLIFLMGLIFVLVRATQAERNRAPAWACLIWSFVLVIVIAATGCGGGSSSTGPTGTPVGTSQVMVTATSGSSTQSVMFTLIVQ
jgi:hypothetical protein